VRFRACITLLLHVSACATPAPSPREPVARDPRLANLVRAAELPWKDKGRCVVQQASQPWPVLVERCYQALDHNRIQFNDPTGKCAVASVGAAALGVGFCVLVAPEIAVGAVVVLGAVVVAAAIAHELDAYRRRGSVEPEAGRRSTRSASQPQPVQEPLAKQEPKPKPGGQDRPPPPLPPLPQDRERPRRCEPVPVPHAGGHDPHNECADKMPGNSFPGWDVLVNGKKFDALQLTVRKLWDVKTDNFDMHSPRSQDFLARVKLPELQREKSSRKSVDMTSSSALKALRTKRYWKNWIEPLPSS
jgi:hypothetical protein